MKVSSKVTLLCGGVGYCQDFNRLSYTWYKGGTIIGKGRQVNLLFENSICEDAVYLCISDAAVILNHLYKHSIIIQGRSLSIEIVKVVCQIALPRLVFIQSESCNL